MFGLGAPELLIIGFVIVLLFGAKKIPGVMKGLGGGIKEFKTAMKDEDNSSDTNKSDINNKETK